jgi:hypothetical protein
MVLRLTKAELLLFVFTHRQRANTLTPPTTC